MNLEPTVFRQRVLHKFGDTFSQAVHSLRNSLRIVSDSGFACPNLISFFSTGLAGSSGTPVSKLLAAGTSVAFISFFQVSIFST